jgi:hypothetical protein
MRRFLFIAMFGVVILGLSISKVQAQSENECNRDLKLFISQHWIYNKEHDVINANDRIMKFFMGTLPESDCMNGRNIEEVKKLFGTPHKISNNKYWYYINPTCHATNSIDCAYFHFDFDKNGIYKEMGISGWSKSH